MQNISPRRAHRMHIIAVRVIHLGVCTTVSSAGILLTEYSYCHEESCVTTYCCSAIQQFNASGGAAKMVRYISTLQAVGYQVGRRIENPNSSSEVASARSAYRIDSVLHIQEFHSSMPTRTRPQIRHNCRLLRLSMLL